MGRRGARLDWAAGRDGREEEGRRCERREAASRADTRLLRRPRPPDPAPSPPNTHPEVKSCCTLSSRSRKVSNISAATATPSLGSPNAAAALAPRTCHPRARSRPAPGRPRPPRPLPRSAPLAALAPPRAAAQPQWAAGPGCGKGAALPFPLLPAS